MNRMKVWTATLAAAMMVAGQMPVQAMVAADSAGPQQKKSKHKEKEGDTAEQLRQMRELLEKQQEEINSLKGQLGGNDTAAKAAVDAQKQAADAALAASQASAAAAESSSKVDALGTTVTDLKSTTQGLQETVITNQARVQEEIESPAAIHYKGVTITPVAFFALEGVYRQRALNSDINTPFNAIPFPSANEGHVSEFNFSGRQSRLGGLFEGSAAKLKLTGYFEADFLSAGATSNNNQSNSYTLRQRQIWGKAETAGGFAITGGQMWSLVTENGVSTNARTEKLPNTIDPQYMVGYSWTRQPGVRFQQRFGNVKTGAITAAVAVEQGQITNFTGGGAGAPTGYFFGGVGQSGGLYNGAGNVGAGNTAGTAGLATYANNVAPDVIVKLAADIPKMHYELGGIARFLRDTYNPILGLTAANVYTYGTGETSHTTTAVGVFGSGRVSPSKYADIAIQAMYGTGIGRYGSSQLSDATIHPDETIAPIRSGHGMLSIETHPAPKLDVFAYYGGEYAQRTLYANSNGTLFGYGARTLNDSGCYALPPAVGVAGTGGSLASTNCASPTRYIQEAMAGFIYRVASGPKFGKLQYSMTYSYLQRNLWSGTVTAGSGLPTGPRALENMVHVGMRYYIP